MTKITREQLFDQDEYSVSWAEHQVWRIHRLMNLESDRLGIPLASLRLGFESKMTVELMSREGHRITYRPEGVIGKMSMPENPMMTMSFEIAWIDPWGFFHHETVSFFEIRFKVMDEMTFQRHLKSIEKAKARLRITTR